jgi:hypothetical protein
VIAFFGVLQQHKNNKAMPATLSSPSLLCCNRIKEGDNSIAAITFFVVLQQHKKKKVLPSLSFFVLLQRSKESDDNKTQKKATIATLPSPYVLHYNNTKIKRQQCCDVCRCLLCCA